MEISTQTVRHKLRIIPALHITTADRKAVRTAAPYLVLLTVSERNVMRIRNHDSTDNKKFHVTYIIIYLRLIIANTSDISTKYFYKKVSGSALTKKPAVLNTTLTGVLSVLWGLL